VTYVFEFCPRCRFFKECYQQGQGGAYPGPYLLSPECEEEGAEEVRSPGDVVVPLVDWTGLEE